MLLIKLYSYKFYGFACSVRFADMLKVAHDSEHLSKFEELLEAAVDLEAVPEEYLICATYDPRLQVISFGLYLLGSYT